VRASVLQSAYRLLAQNGLSNLTIAEVAADSGVHETTIYRRWGNSLALAGDACLAAMAEAVPPPNRGRLRDDLIELVERIIAVLDGPSGCALLDICRIDEANVNAARQNFFQARFATAANIFERAVQRGEWERGVDDRFVLEMLIAPLYFRALVTRQPLSGWPVAAAIEIVLAGLGRDASRGCP
jgi:AcrR family transcriptional regulator